MYLSMRASTDGRRCRRAVSKFGSNCCTHTAMYNIDRAMLVGCSFETSCMLKVVAETSSTFWLFNAWIRSQELLAVRIRSVSLWDGNRSTRACRILSSFVGLQEGVLVPGVGAAGEVDWETILSRRPN
jgi:hypothetical protein